MWSVVCNFPQLLPCPYIKYVCFKLLVYLQTNHKLKIDVFSASVALEKKTNYICTPISPQHAMLALLISAAVHSISVLLFNLHFFTEASVDDIFTAVLVF